MFDGRKTVTSRGDFVELVRSLAHDLEESPSGWENATLDLFLEAMAAWVEDMDGYYKNIGQQVPQNVNWACFADIILAARFYE